MWPPEKAKQSEVGVKASMFNDRLIGTFAVYHIQKVNVAQPEFDNSGFFTLVDGITSKGVEVELNGRVSPALNVSAAYTYQDVTADPGAPILKAPHSLNLWVNYRLMGEAGYTGWNFGLGVNARSREVVTAQTIDFTGYNPGAARVDAVLGYDARQWNARLGVRNLTGRTMYVAGSFIENAVKEQKQAITLTTNMKF